MHDYYTRSDCPSSQRLRDRPLGYLQNFGNPDDITSCEDCPCPSSVRKMVSRLPLYCLKQLPLRLPGYSRLCSSSTRTLSQPEFLLEGSQATESSSCERSRESDLRSITSTIGLALDHSKLDSPVAVAQNTSLDPPVRSPKLAALDVSQMNHLALCGELACSNDEHSRQPRPMPSIHSVNVPHPRAARNYRSFSIATAWNS
ncbi:hypothetical protein IWZ01DRAFT_120367 [Phyllosticta capitalensis]